MHLTTGADDGGDLRHVIWDLQFEIHVDDNGQYTQCCDEPFFLRYIFENHTAPLMIEPSSIRI